MRTKLTFFAELRNALLYHTESKGFLCANFEIALMYQTDLCWPGSPFRIPYAVLLFGCIVV